MKIVINKEQLNMQPEQLLRQAGYSTISSRKTGKESYVRRLGRNVYPRFHIYIDHMGQNAVLDFHLDQKRPSYGQGTRAHAGEYGGQAVEREVERIKRLASENRAGGRQNEEPDNKDKGRGFWRIFGK